MKIISFLLLVCLSITANAQQIIQYYNFKWEPCINLEARYVSLIEPADSLWKREDYYLREKKLQMKGSYKDKECKVRHGLFVYYHPQGIISSKGLYQNGKKEGLWLSYHSNGMMSDSTVFKSDEIEGVSLGWYADGTMRDSILNNGNGKEVQVRWFDNGQLSSAGYTVNAKQHGKWQYFNKEGKLAALEVYDAGALIKREYHNADGSIIADTTNRDREATCTKNFTVYLQQHLLFPGHLKIINADKATVVVNFVIEEDGTIGEAFVSVPFYAEVDEHALKVIKNSPLWKPAIDHNRAVKAYRRQPMTFSQEEEEE